MDWNAFNRWCFRIYLLKAPCWERKDFTLKFQHFPTLFNKSSTFKPENPAIFSFS